jgi:hypothetical protein
MEAVWRLFGFLCHDRSHAVYDLEVHKEDDQKVTVDARRELLPQVTKKVKANTMLTGWFEINRRFQPDPNDEDQVDPRTLTYMQMGNSFVWTESKKKWTQRQRGHDKIVSRMYNVNPGNYELFYLRMLLQHVVGPTCFQDVRTFEGVAYDTYRDACQARQLLRDDSEYIKVMEEVCKVMIPKELRRFFAQLLVSAKPNNVAEMFLRFKYQMSEDFLKYAIDNLGNVERRLAAPDVIAEAMLLRSLSVWLMANNSSLAEQGLPDYQADFIIQYNDNAGIDGLSNRRNILDEYSPAQHTAAANRMRSQMYPEQQAIYDRLVEEVNQVIANMPPKNRTHFLEGIGGCGKTFLFKVFIK